MNQRLSLRVGRDDAEQQRGAGADNAVRNKSVYLLSPHVKLISTSPLSLQREACLLARRVKTSHTCLSVSGEFLSGIVFPAGACFSRLKDDDVCHCMRAALLLRQIEREGNRLGPATPESLLLSLTLY